MERKYEFTEEQKKVWDKTLHRIRAVRDFGKVRAGEIGGWIEKEENLSHYGDCWVGDESIVCENAVIRGYALIRGHAAIRGYAAIGGHAVIREDAAIGGHAEIEAHAVIGGYTVIEGNACVGGYAIVIGGAAIGGHAVIREDAAIGGHAEIEAHAVIGGNAWIRGHAVIGEDACISKTEDYLVVGPIGSRDGYTSFYKNKDNDISVSCGCFRGTIEEFLEAVKKTHGDSKYAAVYKKAMEMARTQIILKEEGKSENINQ